MELSFEIQLQYHAPARVDGKKRVLHARRDVDRQTTWDDVGAWAAATSTYAARAFALEDENGAPAAAIRVSPLAWIKQDQQRRPAKTLQRGRRVSGGRVWGGGSRGMHAPLERQGGGDDREGFRRQTSAGRCEL